VIEISKYLPLDDVINASSPSVFPLLRGAHTKVHLANSSHPFLQMVREHLDSRQVTSLRLADDLVTLRHDFSSF
jgi:hypothetical protein